MKIGDQFQPFELRGVDNQTHAFDANGSGLQLVIFSCNHCPYAIAYVSRIKQLIERYRNENLNVCVINSNDATRYPQDAFDQMPAMAKELGVGAYYLHDETQQVAKAYGAERTPEVFLFDAQGILRYKGAIDDNYQSASAVKQNYLIDAIDALLKNEKPELQETGANGCSIKWKQ